MESGRRQKVVVVCCQELVYVTGFGNSFLYYLSPVPRSGGAGAGEKIVCLPCIVNLKLPAL